MAEQPQNPNPNYLATPPRIYADDIIGRQTDLAHLQTLIGRGGKPVVVSGEGGLGKTTLVKAFCEANGHLFDNIAYLTMNAVFKPEHDALVANEGAKGGLN